MPKKEAKLNQEHTTVDKDLLLEFFSTFAQFEFALKASDFRCKGARDGVKPDWDKFTNSIANKFDKNANSDLQKACDYILKKPPQRQVFKNGSIEWERNYRETSVNDAEFLIKMVKQIRNNLFHGAKHDSKFPNNTERKTLLLESALTILEYCLSLDPNLDYFYKDSHI